MNQATHLRQIRLESQRQEEREALHKQGDVKQLRRLWRYLHPRRHRIAQAVALSIMIAIMTTVPMIVIKYAIDWYIVPGHMGGVIMAAGVLLAVHLVLFFFERYNQYLIAAIGQESMFDLRREIFRHVQQQHMAFFDRNPVGRLITRITSDVNVLNELFAQGIVGIFQQMFMLVVILGALFYFNWYLALWSLIVIPLILLASWNFRNNVFYHYRLSRVRLSRLNTFMQENVTGMRTVQSNIRESRQHEIFDELNDKHRESHIKTVFQYALFFPLVEITAVLGMVIVLWKGGMEYLSTASGTVVTLGQLGFFIMALEKFFEPIKDLSEKYNIIQSAIASGERLFALLDTKPAIVDPANPVDASNLKTRIEFRDVWFAYNEEDWVLKGVSFTIEEGQTVAIVGPTGSGKTTLMSLLCRFYEIQKGAILIDGVDIRQMRQHDLRRKIAIVLQDVFLFHGSVRENVRLGNKQITDEKIEEVCREVGFDEFVKEMPNGYETGVKERGATLSTGQKQLLSFARALAFDPQLLILDEATANIDTTTELKVQEAVRKLCAGRTSLVIAHRLSTIQNAHKILVVHHGHLAEEGTHAELLAKDGLYRRLYDLQYREQAAG
ncbi:ATP-binding cassette domain-containing protein [bacterium]|nr:ATP-binding cassette domain-containing protein [bacterium]